MKVLHEITQQHVERMADRENDSRVGKHASDHWQAVCPHCSGIDSFRWQRPILPSADILLVPTSTAAAEPVAEVPAAASPLPATKPLVSPQIPAPEAPSAPAEKRLETQLAPSVDAARLIN